MAKRPKTAWCNAVNLSGLLFSTPFKGTWQSEIGGYWDEIGNDGAPDLGETDSDGRISFASTDKTIAEAWTQGALAAVKLVRRWSADVPTYEEYVKEFDGQEY